MPAFFDPKRLRAAMEERRLDALLALSRANVYYLGGFLNYFYKPGAAMVLMPADAAKPPAMVLPNWEEIPARRYSDIADIRTFPLWMELDTREELESGTKPQIEKPVQFDLETTTQLIADVLRERQLGRGRIGIELGSMPVKLIEQLRRSLPDATFVEAEDVFYALRAIKAPGEIGLMQRATDLIERGMKAVAGRVPGSTVSDLRLTYQKAVADAALTHPEYAGLSGFRVTTSIGGDFAPKAVADVARAERGQMVFFDSSAYLSAYASDTGRTFVLGEPSPLMRRVLDALKSGVDEALSISKPGLPFSTLFRQTQETIRRNGLPSYTRGHLGHTIGITHVALEEEQPPFVGPNETAVLEQGMVFCYETPYYVHGIGGFQLEEVLEVTASGVRRMTTLPLDFWRV